MANRAAGLRIRSAITDSELVRAAAAGDAEAFGKLMSRHQLSVTRFCFQFFCPAFGRPPGSGENVG
jgi:hypothetical protein